MKKLMCLVLTVLILNSMAAAFQKTTADWSAVKSLTVGSKLSVRLKDGKKIEGILVSVSDASLTLTRNNQTVELGQVNVDKVYQLIPKSAAKSALIGAGIGFGVGAGFGAAIGSYEDIQTVETMAMLGAIGAGIGAFVGTIRGLASKHRRVLVYDAK